VDRSRRRHRGGARDRAGGLPDPGAHRPGAGGPARAADRRDQADRGDRARSEERLRHPLTRALGPALRRSDDRRRPQGRRRPSPCDRGPGGGTPQAGSAAPRSHGPRRAMLNALNADRRQRVARRPPRSLEQDLGAIEAAEGRAVTEQLAGRFQALVIHWGSWLPDVAPSFVVIDPAALVPARPRDRNAVIAELQARTRPGGAHIVLATEPAAREVIPLAPEALQALYGEWQVTRRRRGKASGGFTAIKPERQADTAANVSD